jgi:hypothetical protein
MNHTPHVLHELSEYVDGECRDPDRVARHLQSCPDCARRHVELLKLSSHLQALHGPEVHPAFLTRVMAHVDETRPARCWLPQVNRGLAALLCVVGLFAVGTWRWMPSSTTTPPPESARVNLAWQDDAQVVEALGHLMDMGAPTDLFGDLEETAEIEETPVTLEYILEALADESVEEDFVDPFGHDELGDLMESLGAEDIQTLRSLLETDGNEV